MPKLPSEKIEKLKETVRQDVTKWATERVSDLTRHEIPAGEAVEIVRSGVRRASETLK